MASALPALDRIDRSSLMDSRGTPFRAFRHTLAPRYARVWLDIARGYLAIALITLVAVGLERLRPGAWFATACLAGLALGYAIAYIQLFFHEAAHYNLAPDRKWNDSLANVFIGTLIGQDVKDYRVVHFDHHRLLGTPEDSERSYFEAPTARFIFESLTGVRVWRILLGRARHVRARGSSSVPRLVGRFGYLVVGLALNGAIVFLSVYFGVWSMALGWPLGIILVHPFVNALRQVMEHRGFDARSTVDYAKQPHGPISRMFGDGFVASSLGGAGFNRHLLHHWEPQVSYTRLAELEAYLLETRAAEALRASTTTYAKTLSRLMRAP